MNNQAYDEGKFLVINTRQGWEKGHFEGTVFKEESKGLGLCSGGSTSSALLKGTYYSGPIDSTMPGTRWHRLLLDFILPEGTEVIVYCYASDEKMNIDSMPNMVFDKPMINPMDAFIEEQEGQYLYLRIDLIGTKDKTPVVRSARVDFPRTSYLRYLPAVYQEDEESKSFLEGFLSIFETFYGGIEQKIDHISDYFNIDATPQEFLRWLSGWLAIPEDECWGGERLRKLIKNAPSLYKKRGTREGIEEIIETYLETKPFIVENFQYKYVKENVGDELKKLLERLYGNDPYFFCIILNQIVKISGGRFEVKRITENEVASLYRIIENEKPAYTKAGIVVLQPYIYLDMHTYLGINTCLTEPVMTLDSGYFIDYGNDYVDFGEMEQKPE